MEEDQKKRKWWEWWSPLISHLTKTNRCLLLPNHNNGGMVASCVVVVRPLWVCVKLLHQKCAGQVDHTITQHHSFIHQIKKVLKDHKRSFLTAATHWNGVPGQSHGTWSHYKHSHRRPWVRFGRKGWEGPWFQRRQHMARPDSLKLVWTSQGVQVRSGRLSTKIVLARPCKQMIRTYVSLSPFSHPVRIWAWNELL